ncbi:hypothetical protein [Segatella bryantii]|uniref:hypothetical protein n=1 Tax=Segatella bryantii TaxID=77095 RepID=UPI000887EA6E|nr:hypothetical protein [Segatella bryantii]SDL60439.1 hypothetical protein SAMN04487899_103157 [Segatella bryantii]
MKIRSLSFLNRGDVQKLRDVADMEVSEYIAWFKEREAKNVRINKPYWDLYEKIKQNMPMIMAAQKAVSAIQPAKDPKQMMLEQVPTEELKYYFSEYNNIVDRLSAEGIKNLGQLYGLPLYDISKIPNIGSAALDKIQTMKDTLVQDAQAIVNSWKEFQTIYELPSNYDRNLGLSRNLKNALLEFAQIIEKNKNNKRYIANSQQWKSFSLLATILRKYYDEGKSDNQIAEEEGYTSQHINNVRHDCVIDILSGGVFFKNYKLNQNILDLIASLKAECLFSTLDKFVSYSGSSDTDLLTDLKCDIIQIKDTTFLIPKDTKGIYEKVGKVIIKTLVENPLPTDKDVIYELIVNNDELSGINFDSIFVENVLACEELVDVFNNNLIQIKNQYLTYAGQRYARIIYEAGAKITTEEVRKRYEDIYKTVPSSGPNTAGVYGISCEGKKYWYYGEPKVPIQQKVTEFAENRKIFYYDDIEEEIINEGYTIPQAFRVYITNVCAVDNKDKDHFCHKDYVDDYPHYSWRSPSRYGQINWILNEIKNILKERGSIMIDVLVAEIEERSKSTEYRDATKWTKYIATNYSGDDMPFNLFDGKISKNEPIFSETDFDIIALRGGKYAYYKQIRSIAANEVKKDESGRKSLMDIVSIVNEITDEQLNRNTILRAIKDEQHRFEPIDVEVINENGILYVQWTKKDIIPEPVYVVKPIDDKSDKEEILEVKEAEQRPAIRYRQSVNWQELNLAMKRELSFYSSWMAYDSININDAIDIFTDFLSDANNTNLSQRLPMDLYEYWFASTDSFDRSRYLNDLLIFFEAALKEIYIQLEDKEPPRTKGLADMALLFSGLPDMLLYSKDSKGFRRIAHDLSAKRNIVAHGDTLKLSSLETAKLITDYVALYVYIVAKYHK